MLPSSILDPVLKPQIGLGGAESENMFDDIVVDDVQEDDEDNFLLVYEEESERLFFTSFQKELF